MAWESGSGRSSGVRSPQIYEMRFSLHAQQPARDLRGCPRALPMRFGSGREALWVRGAVVQPILWLCEPKAPRQRPRLPRKVAKAANGSPRSYLSKARCSRAMYATLGRTNLIRRSKIFDV